MPKFVTLVALCSLNRLTNIPNFVNQKYHIPQNMPLISKFEIGQENLVPTGELNQET